MYMLMAPHLISWVHGSYVKNLIMDFESLPNTV